MDEIVINACGKIVCKGTPQGVAVLLAQYKQGCVGVTFHVPPDAQDDMVML
jgi:hypothetical protein